jgi:PhnB protein
MNNARQAMECYQSVFSGTLELNPFKDFQVSTEPADDELLMPSMLEVDNDMTFIASVTPSPNVYRAGTDMTISLVAIMQKH